MKNTTDIAPTTAPFDLSTELQSLIEMLVGHLKKQIVVVDKRLDALGGGGFDVEIARAGSALARALKEISGELRQLDKHERGATNTPEKRFAELLKYVRTLDALQLGQLADVVRQAKSGRAA